MYEFAVYIRGTNLIAGHSIWANSKRHARQILRRQEGMTSLAFEVRIAPWF